MNISQKLYKLRNDKRMTQAEIAKIAGVSDKSVSAWESGTREPKIKAIQNICTYFHLELNAFIDDQTEDFIPIVPNNISLDKAKKCLADSIKENPFLPSGKRLSILFDSSDFDYDIVCFNLGIDQYYLNNWIDDNDLPPKPIVDKILGVFCIKPEELLPENELEDYTRHSYEFGASDSDSMKEIENQDNSHRNVIRIAGRDGSYHEQYLSDAQLSAIKSILDQLPDASDDL